MKITCPTCSAPFHLDAGTSDADAHRFAVLVAGLPAEVGKAMVQYLGLFRSESGCNSWSKVYKLAKEIDQPIRDQRLVYQKKTLVVTHAIWAETFHHLANRPASLTLPLKSHGYLYTMLAGASEKMRHACEAAEEKKKHNNLVNKGKDRATQPSTRSGQGLPAELKSYLGDKDASRRKTNADKA